MQFSLFGLRIKREADILSLATFLIALVGTFFAVSAFLRGEEARLLPPHRYWIAIIFINPRAEDDPTIGPPYQSSVREIVQRFSPYFSLVEHFTPSLTFKGREGKECVMIWQRNDD